MLRVVAVVVEPQASFELACVADIFGIRRDGIPDWAEFLIAAEHPGPVGTKAGYRIVVEHGLAAVDQADVVFVTGWPTPAEPSRALTDALVSAHARGCLIAGLCSGTYALAAAGLLDGRAATTHWSQTDDLSQRYPLVRVTPDVLFVDHGDVATSGGAGAAADLALHIVRRRCGPELAATIARNMVLPPHRQGGQRQYAIDSRPRRQPDPFGGLLDWCVDHLADELSLATMARRARVAPRTLHRRFQSHLGTTPAAWVQQQRIARAATLLQTTNLPVAAVGAAVGMRDPTNFRAQFRAGTGTNPSDYRRTFAPPRRAPGRGLGPAVLPAGG
ncbi:GlxA family transcriptional regulator [Actinocatenispora sera]|uniref:Putative transcription regulator, AraC family protein n=1 Tax=Actinocatenispora sera TaxID=390989 RepID=A0A810KUN4_9ACTN|nr:helix-turn-helix domain-containing protein [Actinocatenispora sera]BCJ26744.1 putative transcription regulator, AraC family protein [Actinocatenispora sera]